MSVDDAKCHEQEYCVQGEDYSGWSYEDKNEHVIGTKPEGKIAHIIMICIRFYRNIESYFVICYY